MRFSRAFLLVFVTNEAALVLNLVNTIVIARALGAASVGAFALVVVSATLLAPVAGMGFSHSLRFMASRDRNRAGLLFVQSFWPPLATGIPLVALFLLSPGATDLAFGELPVRFRGIALAGGLIMAVRLNVAGILFGLQRFKRHSFVMALPNLGTGLTNLVIVAGLGLSVEWALVAWLAWQAVAAAATIAALVPAVRPAWRFDASLVRELLSVGGRAMLAYLLAYLNLRGILILVNRHFGAAAAGIFSVANSLSEILLHAPAALNAVLSAKGSSGESRPEHVARILRLHVVLSGGLGVAMVLAAPWLVSLLYGAGYSQAVGPLRILLGGVFFLGAWLIVMGYINGRYGYPGSSIAIHALFAAGVLGLGAWWIPAFGLQGGAMAQTASAMVCTLLSVALFWRDAKGKIPARDLWPRGNDLRSVWDSVRS